MVYNTLKVNVRKENLEKQKLADINLIHKFMKMISNLISTIGMLAASNALFCGNKENFI